MRHHADLDSQDAVPYELGPVLSARWALKPRHLVVCLFFGGLFTYLNCLPLLDSAIWLDVCQGNWILQHQALPEMDVTQPLTEGMHVAHTSWLSQVVFALAEKWGGPYGVSHLFAILMLGHLLMLGRVFYSQTKRISLMLTGTVLALVVGARFGLSASAEVFGQLGFALLLWVIIKFNASGPAPLFAGGDADRTTWRSAWPLWATVGGLFAVWANLHGSYLLGIVVLACHAMARAIETVWKTRSVRAVLTDRPTRRWVVLTEWALVASLLNPYGPHLIAENIALVGNENLAAMPGWLPLNLSLPNGLVFLASIVALVVVFRHSRRRVQPVEVLLLVVFGAAALPAAPALAWYAIVYAFVLVPHLAEILNRVVPAAILYRSRPDTTPTRSASEVGKFFPRLRFGLVCDVSNLTGTGIKAQTLEDAQLTPRSFVFTLLCGLVLYCSFRLSPIGWEPFGETPRKMEQLLGSADLWGATEYLRRQPSRGLIHAPLGWADCFAWHCAPDASMLMTSNVQWTPRRIWSDHRRMSACEERWQLGMDRYAVETLVINKKEQASLAKAASRSSKWQVAYENEGALILRRTEPVRRPKKKA